MPRRSPAWSWQGVTRKSFGITIYQGSAFGCDVMAATPGALSLCNIPTTAAAARRHVSALFTWAISEGLLGDGAHPVEGSTRPEGSAARDHLLTGAELTAVWRACGEGDLGRITRLLILTGARRQEIGSM